MPRLILLFFFLFTGLLLSAFSQPRQWNLQYDYSLPAFCQTPLQTFGRDGQDLEWIPNPSMTLPYSVNLSLRQMVPLHAPQSVQWPIFGKHIIEFSIWYNQAFYDPNGDHSFYLVSKHAPDVFNSTGDPNMEFLFSRSVDFDKVKSFCFSSQFGCFFMCAIMTPA